ncbi:MAG: pyridoxamine 5'-phosphate oxidase family protein [Candidatus Kaelpia aquatica]|nr:pyridoxamine 5'-phosphate oxidase family protein [Candidatus Kaelpia aquatica]
MIEAKLKELFQNVTFIDVASCDFKGRPNVAPKFLLKYVGNLIYLIDYIIGRTYDNLRINPRVSLPAMNFDTLNGYQINGEGEILESGTEYDKLTKELREKIKRLSVDRIIEGLKSEKIHDSFEIVFSKKVVIFKVKVEEIVEIGPTGELKREKI